MESPTKRANIFNSMMQAPSFAKKDCPRCLTTSINAPYHRIQEQIELYQWRSKNSNHVISYQWIKIQPFDEKNVAFTLKISQKLVSLEQIKIVKGSNIFKNIAKIFMSFSLLLEKFGPFEVSSKMIAYDTFFEPYVWINEDYRKNQYKRDLISEQEFASNILFIVLKHDHKFQSNHLLDFCCQIKGQGFSLKQISNFFNDFHQRQSLHQRSKIMKSVSPDSTLCFSKQSKIKKQRYNKDFKGLNTINSETYRSILKNSSKEKETKHSFQRTASLKQIKPPSSLQSEQNSIYLTNSGSSIKINILKEADKEQWQNSRKDYFLPIHQQLQISIDYDNEQEVDHQKEVKIIQLEQLDKFKTHLAKSIITGSKK